MNPPSARRRHLVATAVLAVALTPVVAPVAQPASSAAPGPAAAAGAPARPVVARAAVRIPRPASGRAAVRLLGDQLPAAAHANGMTAEGLRDLLRTDPSAGVDRSGRVLFTDPAPERVTASAAPAALAPLDQTFALHSKPGSSRTIYLDFDGTEVTGTAWNHDQYGVAAGFHPGWDPAGDGPSFNADERARIQSVWARVAEDYAPFDVDVTTEDPGADAITRSGSADQVFGTRVLISGSTQAAAAVCSSKCGGVAFLDAFDEPRSHAFLQPAWVFPSALGSDTKAVAEAASHEAGHNFGLSHDATATSSYYGGHGSWAPIMGSGYSRPIVQWSRGSYAGASTTEDDLAIIAASGAPVRADEAGATLATAAGTLPSGPAYVSADDDQDVYALGTCRGDVTVAAEPAAISPNLDISLELLDASGTVRAAADPASATASRDRATGLGATARATLAAGAYFARVDGTGNGGPTTGYDGYGSIGSYTLAVAGCGATTSAPGEVGDLAATATADGRGATLTWAAPVDDGGSAVTGYTVSQAGAVVATVGADARSHRVADLAPGTSYTWTVAAVNAAGTGAPVTATVTTPTVPGLPTAVTGARDAAGTGATVSWGPASTDGRSPVTGYEVRLDGGSWAALGAAATGHAFAAVDGAAHQLAVRAVNAVGAGTPAVVELAALPSAPPTTTSPPPPPPTTTPTTPTPTTRVGAPTDLRVVVDALAGTARLTWLAPVAGTAGPVAGYQVLRDGATVGGVAADVTGVTLTGLARGTTFVLGVQALDPLGPGEVASVSVTVPGAPPAPEGVTVRTRSGTATLTWRPPTSYEAGLVTGWRVRALRDGVPVSTAILPAGARSWSHPLHRRVRTVLDVAAVSGDLTGPAARTGALRGPARPSAPRIGRAHGDGRADGRAVATLTWSPPASTGGTPVKGYRVLGRRLAPTGRVVARRSWTVLDAGRDLRARLRLPSTGTWVFAVRATNSVGTGPASRLSERVRAR